MRKRLQLFIVLLLIFYPSLSDSKYPVEINTEKIDLNNQFFDITNINSSTIWRIGESSHLEWDVIDTSINFVDILLISNSTADPTLLAVTSNDGQQSFTFDWSVYPGEILLTGYYLIRILNNANRSQFVDSDVFLYQRNWVEFTSGISEGDRYYELQIISFSFTSFSTDGLIVSLWRGSEIIRNLNISWAQTIGLTSQSSILPSVHDGSNFRLKIDVFDMHVFSPYFTIIGWEADIKNLRINSENENQYPQTIYKTVKPGNTYRIKWDTTGEIDEIYLKLLDLTITNEGYYDWTVSSDIIDNSNFSVESKLHRISQYFIVELIIYEPTSAENSSDQEKSDTNEYFFIFPFTIAISVILKKYRSSNKT